VLHHRLTVAGSHPSDTPVDTIAIGIVASRDGGSKPPYPRKQRVDIKTEVLPGEDVPMEDARRLVADP
jgi:hypothetical protein